MMPLVSVGMAVFNGEKTVRDAIESILNQTYQDFELIISDNASTDNTSEICKEYSVRDNRITYIRQAKNLGPLENYLLVLNKSKGKYFMWAASDDVRSANFLECNVNFLNSNDEYVASTCKTRFYGDDFDGIRMGDQSLDQESSDLRILNFFKTWHANGRFYSLIRRHELIQFPFKYEAYLASDWIWVIHLATLGKMKRLESGWVTLGIEGESNVTNIFKCNIKIYIDHFIPFRLLIKRTLFFLENKYSLSAIKIYISLLKLSIVALKLKFFSVLTELDIYKYYKKIKSKYQKK